MAASDKGYTHAQGENLITILAHDKKNGRIVARLIEPELFEGELRTVAERLVAYWKRHNTAPRNHTADLFADIIEDPTNRKAGTYRRILRSMSALSEGINTNYVLETLKTFSRVQRMKDAILKSAEKLNSQQELAIGEVEEILSDLLRAREFEFDSGVKLTDIGRVLEFLHGHYSEFRMGIDAFDRRNVVPSRGAVVIFLAPTGFGKSWFLIHVGKNALMQRKKVLHVTLEMPAEEVVGRYWQSLFSLTKNKVDEAIEIQTLDVDDDWGRLTSVGDREEIKPSFALSDGRASKFLKAEFSTFEDAGRHHLEGLRVKQFAPRSLSMAGLRAYLDGLEAQGWIPDMVVLDYIGITATDAKNHRITLGRAFEDFRAIMIERNMAGVTAAQVSRDGAEARVVSTTHVSEDWSLIGTADVAVTFSRTMAEEQAGLARLFVPKARAEKDKFGVVITQSYETGQFCLQSALLDRVYWKHLDTLKAADSEEEDEKD